MTDAEAIQQKHHLSEATKRRNPHLFVNPAPDQTASPEIKAAYIESGAGEIRKMASAENKKRLRQSSKPLMNKLEAEWLEMLKKLYAPPIRAQALTFRIANGLRFTPDFTYVKSSGHHCADEVKGPHAWDDAKAKLKMAASVYPEWCWRLVWKDKAGQWQTQEILA